MLLQLHREIDARAREIAASQPDWPCCRGCDHCCRHLAEPPRLIRAEWNLVEDGVAFLPESVQAEIQARIRASDAHVCPFLDPAAGICLVYQHRPIACRTYGFYVDRDRGLYCGQIADRVDSGEFAQVVWGNVAGIEARLESSGPKITLAEWFSDLPEWPLRPLPTPPSTSPDPCAARSAVRSDPPSAPR